MPVILQILILIDLFDIRSIKALDKLLYVVSCESFQRSSKLWCQKILNQISDSFIVEQTPFANLIKVRPFYQKVKELFLVSD